MTEEEKAEKKRKAKVKDYMKTALSSGKSVLAAWRTRGGGRAENGGSGERGERAEGEERRERGEGGERQRTAEGKESGEGSVGRVGRAGNVGGATNPWDRPR